MAKSMAGKFGTPMPTLQGASWYTFVTNGIVGIFRRDTDTLSC